MNDSAQTPDRRPLVYGAFAVAILIAAAFLFWPQPKDDRDLVLTPESIRAQQAAEETSPLGDVTPAQMGADGGLAPADALESEREPVEADEVTRLDSDTGPASETHIDGERSATTPTKTATTTTDSRPTATKSTPTESVERTPQRSSGASSLTQPGTSGDWVLNVGAFSTRANAEKQVAQLSRLGVAAHVLPTSKDDGSALYRVRVGYFPSSSAAKSYGEWLKKSQNLDSWAGKR